MGIQEVEKTPFLRNLGEVTPENDLTKAEAHMLYQALGVANMSKAETRLFIHIAHATSLDPLLKQIYVVPYQNKVNGSWITKYQAVTSIDGLRIIARRSKSYKGQTQPEFYSKSLGEWVDVWVSSDEEPFPHACRVGVIHSDFSEPLVGLAHWSEYVKTTGKGDITKFWKEKPTTMISKCAEALALRKAFPNDTSAIYAEEEFNAPEPVDVPVVDEPRTAFTIDFDGDEIITTDEVSEFELSVPITGDLEFGEMEEAPESKTRLEELEQALKKAKAKQENGEKDGN